MQNIFLIIKKKTILEKNETKLCTCSLVCLSSTATPSLETIRKTIIFNIYLLKHHWLHVDTAVIQRQMIIARILQGNRLLYDMCCNNILKIKCLYEGIKIIIGKQYGYFSNKALYLYALYHGATLSWRMMPCLLLICVNGNMVLKHTRFN